MYQRRDGRWEGQLRLPSGHRKSVYAATTDQLLDRLSDLRWRSQHDLPVRAARGSVHDYLAYWLEVTRRRIRPTTYEAYELNVRRVNPHLGHVRLARLSAARVQAAYDALLASGLSCRSVEQAHAVLHRALNQALHWGLIAMNPTELTVPPRSTRREMTALTCGQLRSLLVATREDRWHPLWVLLYRGGQDQRGTRPQMG